MKVLCKLSGFSTRDKATAILLTVAIALFAWIYSTCMDRQIVGFMHDDGIYVITAKSLATGKGFSLPNLTNAWMQVKYPIFYPFILSIGWLLNPSFPENIPYLHWLTTTFALISLPLLYGYLRHTKQASTVIAALITLLVGSNFFFMFYATSLMSEAPYFFLSLFTLFVAETKLSTSSKKWMTAVIILSAFTFHTRTIGIALIAAVTAWLFVQKRYREAITYTGITLVLTIILWMLWVKWHAPATITPLNYSFAYVYGGYGIEYGINAPSNPIAYIQAWMERGLQPLLDGMLYILFPELTSRLQAFPGLNLISSLGLAGFYLFILIHTIQHRKFSISGFYIVFYILLLATWMYPNQAARFLTVILPWLWLPVFQTVQQKIKSTNHRITFIKYAISVSLLTWLTAWPAWQGYQVLHRMRSQHHLEPSGKYAVLWQEYQSAFEWIQHYTPAESRIGGIWDPTFYLYANRRSFGLFTAALQPIQGQVTKQSFARLMASMQHYRVQFVINEPFMLNHLVKEATNPVVDDLMQQYPQAFQLVYTTPHGMIRIYRLQ
jgi:hypothetical protein